MCEGDSSLTFGMTMRIFDIRGQRRRFAEQIASSAQSIDPKWFVIPNEAETKAKQRWGEMRNLPFKQYEYLKITVVLKPFFQICIGTYNCEPDEGGRGNLKLIVTGPI